MKYASDELREQLKIEPEKDVVVLQMTAPLTYRASLNMDVVALVDCSPSTKKYFPVVKACLQHLIGRLTPADKMGLICFGTTSATAFDLQSVTRSKRPTMMTATRNIKVRRCPCLSRAFSSNVGKTGGGRRHQHWPRPAELVAHAQVAAVPVRFLSIRRVFVCFADRWYSVCVNVVIVASGLCCCSPMANPTQAKAPCTFFPVLFSVRICLSVAAVNWLPFIHSRLLFVQRRHRAADGRRAGTGGTLQADDVRHWQAARPRASAQSRASHRRRLLLHSGRTQCVALSLPVSLSSFLCLSLFLYLRFRLCLRFLMRACS